MRILFFSFLFIETLEHAGAPCFLLLSKKENKVSFKSVILNLDLLLIFPVLIMLPLPLSLNWKFQCWNKDKTTLKINFTILTTKAWLREILRTFQQFNKIYTFTGLKHERCLKGTWSITEPWEVLGNMKELEVLGNSVVWRKF